MGYRRDTVSLSVAFAISLSKKRKRWATRGADLWQGGAASEYGECGTG